MRRSWGSRWCCQWSGPGWAGRCFSSQSSSSGPWLICATGEKQKQRPSRQIPPSPPNISCKGVLNFLFRNETMESSLGDEDRSLRREEIVIEYWLILLYSDIVDFINGCSISMIIYCNKTIKSEFFLVGVEWQDSSKSLVMVILGLAFGSINNLLI